MSKPIIIGNYTIDTPIKIIVEDLKTLTNGKKLRDINDKTDELIVTCPNSAHSGGQERKPACHINISRPEVPAGACNCFVCGLHGSFANFVAATLDSSVDYAQQWLTARYGIRTQTTIQLGDDISVKNTAEKPYFDKSILDQYQPWCPYFEKRKLSRSVCEAFDLKYDPYMRQVIFPVYDTKDRLVMLARRSIDTKTFYMDENMEKPVYCLNSILNNNISSCMIVEGLIDAMTCWDRGVPAIATLGQPSPEQIEAINKSCITTLYVAFDADWAGRKFTGFLKQHLSPRILTVDIKLPPNRKDVNDLTIEEWQDLIKNQINPQNPSEIIV